jgi:hypothetical protein
MSKKGQARGPNHFIDPEVIIPGTPTGVEVGKQTKNMVSKRWVKVAEALVNNLGEWHLATIYPLKPDHDMVATAQHTVDRLNRTGLNQPHQMLALKRHILKVCGTGAFDNWRIEAKMMRQADGSLQVWARYTERLAA